MRVTEGAGQNADLDLIIRPALFEPTAEITAITEDLSPSGRTEEYSRAARQCAQEDRSFEEFLHYLVELEVAQRQRKACQRRLKEAGFPSEKEIADFDFATRVLVPFCVRVSMLAA